jgi:peptidoglycan hydrolase CwlO-like protein
VAGSLGSFATTNLSSIDNLKERLRQRNHLINQLRDQIRNSENNIKNDVSKGLKQARANDRQEIQQIKSNLEEANKTAQAS